VEDARREDKINAKYNKQREYSQAKYLTNELDWMRMGILRFVPNVIKREREGEGESSWCTLHLLRFALLRRHVTRNKNKVNIHLDRGEIREREQRRLKSFN